MAPGRRSAQALAAILAAACLALGLVGLRDHGDHALPAFASGVYLVALVLWMEGGPGVGSRWRLD